MRDAAKKLIPLLLALVLLAGCGGADAQIPAADPEQILAVQSPVGKELTTRPAADRVFSLNYDSAAGVNPLRAGSAANMQFWGLLYDSLFTVDENFCVSSELVTDTVTEDNIWWTFYIDTEVQFSDGSNLRAVDVAYSLQRAQQTAYYQSRLSCIQGISSYGGNIVAVSLHEPNSQLPALLNIPVLKKGDYFEDYPLGTGPYHLSEEHDRLLLSETNRHAADLPLGEIYLRDYMDTGERINAFEDSLIDLVTNDPTGMYSLGYGSGNDVRHINTSNLQFIGFNTEGRYFQTAAARCAVASLIDRDRITENEMKGCAVATALPVHPLSPLYDGSWVSTEYDPEHAAALFRSAGVSDLDGDGALEMRVTGINVELNLRFIVNNDSLPKVEAARRIAGELNALGITTTLRELAWADYIEALETGEFDLYYGELRLTPDWDLRCLFRQYEQSKKEDADYVGMNYGNVRDTAYVRLYGQYLAAAEGEERSAAFQQVCRYLSENAPIIPICFEQQEVLTHRGIVTELCATQYDLFHRFYDWDIQMRGQ